MTLRSMKKNDTKKYEDKIFTFRKLSYDDFFLSIVKLIKNRGLAEEEASKVNNTPRVVTRELVEIRDLYLVPKIDLENPWQIKKKIR
ncbi:hypothetical protein H5410_051798, partial [Solanum commersonii]